MFFEHDLLHVSYLVVFRQGRHFESRFLEVRTISNISFSTSFSFLSHHQHPLYPVEQDVKSDRAYVWVKGEEGEVHGAGHRDARLLPPSYVGESTKQNSPKLFGEIQKYQDAFPFMTSSARVSSPPRVGLKIELNIVFPLCLSNIVPNWESLLPVDVEERPPDDIRGLAAH